jgi:hypothetical protein
MVMEESWVGGEGGRRTGRAISLAILVEEYSQRGL